MIPTQRWSSARTAARTVPQQTACPILVDRHLACSVYWMYRTCWRPCHVRAGPPRVPTGNRTIVTCAYCILARCSPRSHGSPSGALSRRARPHPCCTCPAAGPPSGDGHRRLSELQVYRWTACEGSASCRRLLFQLRGWPPLDFPLAWR